MIFVRYPFPCDLKILDFGTLSVTSDQIKHNIGSYLGCDHFSLFHDGRKLQNAEVVSDNSTVHVTFSLPGGKGGFGSMLRAIGAQIEKTTNREACRDLSGRRLRDINEEQRLKKWIAKEAEREAEKLKRRQARLERLKTKAPHKFFDYEYEKEISELPERIDEALSEGLQKVKQPKKRPHENPEETKLPKKSWLLDDIPVSSSDSDSDETNAASGDSASKKMKTMSEESSSQYDADISESSMSCPSTSKDSYFIPEASTSSNTRHAFSATENDTDSDKMVKGNVTTSQTSESSVEDTEESRSASENVTATDKNEEAKVLPEENACTVVVEGKEGGETSNGNNSSPEGTDKGTKKKDVPEQNNSIPAERKKDSPIDLLDFQSASELEALGLDHLKSALMVRGLKCGGTLSDRAQRLWKVRGLEPHQYPSNLLAKNKK